MTNRKPNITSMAYFEQMKFCKDWDKYCYQVNENHSFEIIIRQTITSLCYEKNKEQVTS